VLADFRDALNRVRTAAWAAQQYVARKETEQDSTSVLSFLAGERIRAAYHLCQAISEDLKQPEIAVPAGSLIQLHEVMSAVAGQLKGIVNKLGWELLIVHPEGDRRETDFPARHPISFAGSEDVRCWQSEFLPKPDPLSACQPHLSLDGIAQHHLGEEHPQG
jgi:hypothetical protein